MNLLTSKKNNENPITDDMIKKLLIIAKKIREAEKEERELIEKIMKENIKDERFVY